MVAASLCRSLSAIAHGYLTVRCVSGYPHAHAWYEVSGTGMRPWPTDTDQRLESGQSIC